jgi:hypothetical protein
LSVKVALQEFELQQSFSPTFRKVAVRARSYDEA